MKKIFLLSLCFIILVGCEDKKNYNDNEISEDEISLKYKEMENKLIEYGELVYENEQWLNNYAKEVKTVMTLRDLSERNGYDISMFVDPKTNKQCDLDVSRIEFIITDVSNLNDIKYKFNPVLVCGDYNAELEIENTINEEYDNLYNKLLEYMNDVYGEDVIDSKNLDLGTYKITLNEFNKKGYDVSMFVNPDTKKQCNLEDTYAILEVSESDGKKNYKYRYYINCQ